MWIIFSVKKKIEKLPFHALLGIVGVGAVAALHWVTFYAAIKMSNVSIGVLCFSAVSFFTAFVEPYVFKKKIDVSEVLFGLSVMAGLAVVTGFNLQYTGAILIGLLSAFLASVFPVLNKKFLETYKVETVITWQITGGCLFLTILLPLLSPWVSYGKVAPSANDVLWLLILSWVCSVFAFILSMNALKKLPTFTVNMSFGLEPFYTIILAFIVFKENKLMTSSFYWGLAIIVISLLSHYVYLLYQHKNKDII